MGKGKDEFLPFFRTIRNPLTDFVTDKTKSKQYYIRYFLNRTQQIFKYDGLPETIPQNWYEADLQCNGNVCITRANDGNLYSFVGSPGGELNEYYLPTIYNINNPFLKFSKTIKLNSDGIMVLNDSQFMGLLPIISRYAELLVECDISLRMNIIMSRATGLISANNDTTKASAELFLKQLEDGKIGVIADDLIFEGLKVQPYQTGATQTITNLIEVRQYYLGMLFNEIGLNSNFNLKRESINSTETQLNRDCLFPLIDEMLEERRKAWEKVNSMFGTSVTVSLNSVWELSEKEMEVETIEETEQSEETQVKEGDI